MAFHSASEERSAALDRPTGGLASLACREKRRSGAVPERAALGRRKCFAVRSQQRVACVEQEPLLTRGSGQRLQQTTTPRRPLPSFLRNAGVESRHRGALVKKKGARDLNRHLTFRKSACTVLDIRRDYCVCRDICAWFGLSVLPGTFRSSLELNRSL